MAKKALVLITNSFPFGKGETFVDNEIRYYSKFYPVYVVSIDNVCPQRFLNIPNNISIYQMPKLSRCNKIIWYLRSLLRQVFYEELLFLLKERNYFFISCGRERNETASEREDHRFLFLFLPCR